MTHLLYIPLVILASLFCVDAAICKPSRISCRSKDSYTFCVDMGDSIIFLEYLQFKCREGKVCSEDTYFPCVLESEVPPTTTTPSPTSLANISDTTLETSKKPSATTAQYTSPISTSNTLAPTTTAVTIDTVSTTEQTSSTVPFTITTSPLTLTSTPFSSPAYTVTENYEPTTTAASVTSTYFTPSLQTTTTIPEETTTHTSISTDTTLAPTPPACPNPTPGAIPKCKKTDLKFPGPICTKYYECIPLWFGYDAKENICPKGQAFSASLGKCVVPPDGCVCAN